MHFPISNIEPEPASPALNLRQYTYTALTDLHLLLLADLDTTQSLFMSSFESNYFPLGSGIDSNRYSQKMLQPVVKSKRFLGKALEPWVYLIHFPRKLPEFEVEKALFLKNKPPFSWPCIKLWKCQLGTNVFKPMSNIYTSQNWITAGLAAGRLATGKPPVFQEGSPMHLS